MLTIADLELDRNLWMRLAECAQPHRQNELRCRIDRGNAHGRLFLRRRAVRHPGALLEQPEGLTCVGQEHLTGWAQLHPATIALGQRDTNFITQGGDASRHRWLRHVQTFGRSPHRAILGDSNKRLQLRECHSHCLMN